MSNIKVIGLIMAGVFLPIGNYAASRSDGSMKLPVVPPTVATSTVPTGEVLFSDDFNDGNADGWTTVGDGTWFVDDFNYVVDMGMGAQLKGHAVAGDNAWTDYTFEADAMIVAGWSKDLLFRYIDEDNYNSISLIEVVDFFSFVKVKNGIAEIDMLFEYPQQEYEWHHIKIQVMGGLISVYVNGDPAFTYDDTGSEITHGKIGFQGYTGSDVGELSTRFDNVVVQEILPGQTIYLPIVIN